ncbi:MAG: hypothetical protein ACRCYU_20230 [Nocardioides sp.]
MNVTAENVAALLDANFVFLAMDTGPDKKAIVTTLIANGIPFIDTGVGLSKDADGIAGQIRITTSTPGRSEHISRDELISYFAGESAEYDTNLQVDDNLTHSLQTSPSSGTKSSSASMPTTRTNGTPCLLLTSGASTIGTARATP